MSVHPRAGGEHPASRVKLWEEYGSSPRGRGTRIAAREEEIKHRFIPARAGNTPVGRLAQGGDGRFIPARAGNTA